MQVARRLLATRHLALLLCAATLLLKLIVPTGYMLDGDGGRLVVTLCPGTASRAMATDMPGMHGDGAGHGPSKEHGKAETPCAFAGLSAAMTGAIDPVQLAAPVVFVMGVGLVGSALPPRSGWTHLRPPPERAAGPPLTD